MINYSKKCLSQQDASSFFQEFRDLIANKTNCQPKIYGNGYLLCCPSHNDKKPSLSISEGTDGRILLHCFTGCTIEEICLSLNKKKSALFPPKIRR